MKKKLFRYLPLLLAFLILTGCQQDKVLSLRADALSAYEKGDYAQAGMLFEEALMAGEGMVSEVQTDILRYMADCDVRTGQFESAMDIYERLIELTGSETDKRLLLELTEAVTEAERINMFNEAVTLENEGKYKEALEAFISYSEQYPGDVEALKEIEFLKTR
ncbi:MAG: tetratricopeptide repeat protein [Eubacteriales bacterium]|nr:tetratricopeptide repeat protein [Eubacteriales bacterium]